MHLFFSSVIFMHTLFVSFPGRPSVFVCYSTYCTHTVGLHVAAGHMLEYHHGVACSGPRLFWTFALVSSCCVSEDLMVPPVFRSLRPPAEGRESQGQQQASPHTWRLDREKNVTFKAVIAEWRLYLYADDLLIYNLSSIKSPLFSSCGKIDSWSCFWVWGWGGVTMWWKVLWFIWYFLEHENSFHKTLC